MRTSQWFVECVGFSNEVVAELLSEQGLADECKCVGLRDREGRLRNVWNIPSEFVTYLRKVKMDKYLNPSLEIYFWIRSNNRGPISPADFVEIQRDSKKVLEAMRRLNEIKKKRI